MEYNNQLLSISLVLLVFFAGCTKQVPISLDTYADIEELPYGFPPGSTFFIAGADDKYKHITSELTHKIGMLLRERDYAVSDNPKEADYIITFSVDMKNEKVSVNVPIYIPGQTQTTTGSVYGTYGYANYQGQTQTSGTCIYVPELRTYYYKFLIVAAYNAKNVNKKSNPLWTSTAGSYSQCWDLRDTLNYLLTATFKYFGVNTQKYIHSSISGSNKKVKKLRTAV